MKGLQTEPEEPDIHPAGFVSNEVGLNRNTLPVLCQKEPCVASDKSLKFKSAITERQFQNLKLQMEKRKYYAAKLYCTLVMGQAFIYKYVL